MNKINLIKPFPKFCYTIGMIPTSYKESLTYEEQLLWFCDFLQNTVIPTVNNNGLAVEELQNLFVQLQDFVNNYFDNLDVQEEINNKLDEMAEDGTLAEILSNFINVLIYENTINSMKENIYLKNGDIVKTLGFYEEFDEGGANYKITNEELIANDIDIIELNNGLFAKLVLKENMTTRQFGCKGDGLTNDTVNLQYCFDKLVLNYNTGFKLKIIGNLLLNPRRKII